MAPLVHYTCVVSEEAASSYRTGGCKYLQAPERTAELAAVALVPQEQQATCPTLPDHFQG